MFEPGDHLKVWRRIYHHHGIYVGDDHVVEFGAGTLADKRLTSVQEVPLRDFADGGAVSVVHHAITHLGFTYSEAGPPNVSVKRALWLADNQPPTYHLAGRNCEHIAMWCATGNCYESFQVKCVAGGAAASTLPLLLSWNRLPSAAKVAIPVASIGAAYFTFFQYNRDSIRFGEHVKRYPG